MDGVLRKAYELHELRIFWCGLLTRFVVCLLLHFVVPMLKLTNVKRWRFVR